MQVELVSTTTSDGVKLHGYLRTPTAGVRNAIGVDVVICHHGVGANFYNASFFDAMGDELLARGVAILRVNNRGHDAAFLDGQRRLGSEYEIVDDCRADITAWLDFATARGFTSAALWGHSLGAVKTVYFLAVQDDPRVVCALASSPPRFSHATYATSHDAERFQRDIAHAQELVDAGKTEEIFEALIPVQRPFSAGTYLDKYGPEARYDYLARLSNVKKPLMLTLGSQEAGDVNFAPLAEQGPGFSSRWPGIEFRNIDGADHSYASRTSELWSAIEAWLTRATQAAAAA